MRMILNLFAGGHAVKILKDAHISAASASATTDVAKDAEVTLTVTAASGYDIAEYEVLEGGVTVNPSTKKFVMGEADVTIMVRSALANNYMVTEECMIDINGTREYLHTNETVVKTKNGVPKQITVKNGGKVISDSDAVKSPVDQGILVKI